MYFFKVKTFFRWNKSYLIQSCHLKIEMLSDKYAIIQLDDDALKNDDRFDNIFDLGFTF